MRITLTEVELEKLELDADALDGAEVGDMVHIFAMAKITSMSKEQTSNGCRCRIELAITDMAVEDEDEEDEPD